MQLPLNPETLFPFLITQTFSLANLVAVALGSAARAVSFIQLFGTPGVVLGLVGSVAGFIDSDA